MDTVDLAIIGVPLWAMTILLLILTVFVADIDGIVNENNRNCIVVEDKTYCEIGG